MKAISLLDVTLRDGGYQTNFHFNAIQLRVILTSLDTSGIEYIEVGYKNGSLNPIENIGETGLCNNAYLKFCRKFLKTSRMAVMLHPKNVTKKDLVDLKASGVDLVRICIAKNGYTIARPVIDTCHDLGMSVSVNLTRVSRYSELELDQAIQHMLNAPIDMLYLADSNGSMLPSKIAKIYDQYTSISHIKFGFHAHDNLGMAQANAVASVNSGVQLIDVSLAGMGKGIGNLKAEFFIAYMHALNIKKYDLDVIRQASNFIRTTLEEKEKTIDKEDFLMGISDLTIDDINKMKSVMIASSKQ